MSSPFQENSRSCAPHSHKSVQMIFDLCAFPCLNDLISKHQAINHPWLSSVTFVAGVWHSPLYMMFHSVPYPDPTLTLRLFTSKLIQKSPSQLCHLNNNIFEVSEVRYSPLLSLFLFLCIINFLSIYDLINQALKGHSNLFFLLLFPAQDVNYRWKNI